MVIQGVEKIAYTSIKDIYGERGGIRRLYIY